MHERTVVVEALELAEQGLSQLSIAQQLGVPRRTVNDWIRGYTPREPDPKACSRCGAVHDSSRLDESYAHLLGLYLGDGCLSLHPRGVYRLRITLDARYPGIIDAARESTLAVIGAAGVYERSDHCVEVGAYSRQWPCLFPQHGAGPKHHRLIWLSDWQRDVVAEWPEQLVRGLIESDGCRFENTGRGNWSHARYAFSNRSLDIHGIFRAACDLIGVRWTESGAFTTYVSRVADVARLDEFIGPKR